MYIAADCCLQRDIVTVILSVLLYSTFTVQTLYKLYSVQLNCTYSNYTQAAATCSAAQQHTNSPADIFCSAVQPAVLNYTVSVSTYSVTSLDRTFQINVDPKKHCCTSSQHYKTRRTFPLMRLQEFCVLCIRMR